MDAFELTGDGGFGALSLTVLPRRQVSSGAPSALAQHAASQLRTRLEWRDPDVLSLAAALSGKLCGGSPGPAASALALAPLPQLEALAEELVREILHGRISVERREQTSLNASPSSVPPQLAPLRPAPAAPATFDFEVRFLDETGAAIPGVPVQLKAGDETRSATTNAAGVALLEGVKATTGEVSVPDKAPLASVLAPRWKFPRTSNFRAPSNSFERIFDGSDLVFPLKAVLSHTVVLRPYFKCHEVPGSYFDFGRSFVRREGIQRLSEIAEALNGDDDRRGMIFGHTDLSGSEGLNKELSERRAKALHALFVHDADAWEELCSGSADGPLWKEKWDVREAQHMLNTLGVTDDAGLPLPETGVRDAATIAGIKRFRTGNYPDRPDEQVLLPPEQLLGVDGRRELFLAYAKRVTRKPLDKSRFPSIGGSPFMGCGEYNPLSLSNKDQESRRAVVFVFLPASEPTGLPCQLRNLAPCKQNLTPAPKSVAADSPPYRCAIYRKIASACPCNGGPDLSHDLLLHFPIPLEQANALEHVFIVESEDGTIVQERALASDARADDGQRAELYFSHLPENHSYRLLCREGGELGTLMDYGTLSELQARVQSSQGAEAGSTELHDSWLAVKDQDPQLEQDQVVT